MIKLRVNFQIQLKIIQIFSIQVINKLEFIGKLWEI